MDEGERKRGARCVRWEARAGPAADRSNRKGRERKKKAEVWREDVVNERGGQPGERLHQEEFKLI